MPIRAIAPALALGAAEFSICADVRKIGTSPKRNDSARRRAGCHHARDAHSQKRPGRKARQSLRRAILHHDCDVARSANVEPSRHVV